MYQGKYRTSSGFVYDATITFSFSSIVSVIHQEAGNKYFVVFINDTEPFEVDDAIGVPLLSDFTRFIRERTGVVDKNENV